MFVDTHTHFYDQWLLPDAEEAIERALKAGVGKMIQADVDSSERPAMWEIGNRHPGVIYQMLGLYPCSVTENWKDELDLVYALAQKVKSHSSANNKSNSVEQKVKSPSSAKNKADATEGDFTFRGERVVAIGEIGLDYHEGKEFAGLQKEVLRLQFELAAKLDLPVNIHLRDAWEDFFEVVEDCRHLHLRGNLHCFTASYEVYERANKYADFSVGIGGVITFKNAGLPKVVERIPMEKILLETDAPYIAPVPYRGRRNESSYLPIIAAKVAEVKGVSLEEIERITTRNAERLFQI